MKFGSAKTHRGLMVILTAVLAVLLSVIALAEGEHGEVIDSGECGDNLTWTLYESIDGVSPRQLEISGTGDMYDYDRFSNTPWYNYIRRETISIILNHGITSIGDYAFDYDNRENERYGLSGSLKIPDTVLSIGDCAFGGCRALTGSLTIGDRVISIGNGAFMECTGFTGSLTIGNSVESIGNSAFYGCNGLTGNLKIPDSVVSIGNSAFSHCSGFTGSLKIPENTTSIEGFAFSGCSGFNGILTIGNSVTTIGENAFRNCSGFTGDLILPENLMTIGTYAFTGCTGFTGTLTFPESVSRINDKAFYNCSGLTSATFNGNAPTMGEKVFDSCSEGFIVYCYQKYASTYITHAGKWSGYPLVIIDAEIIPEITLGLTGVTLDVGSTIQFAATVTGDAGETSIVWTSSDITVASVEEGTVTALAEGTAVITAAAKAGGTPVSFEVKVNPAPAPVIRGDIDGDGFITAKDRMILARYLAGWQGYNQYFEK